MTLRREAFLARSRDRNGSPAVPADVPSAAAADGGPPELPASEVTPELLRAAILARGCLLVRGLVPPERTGALVAGIDRAFDGFDAQVGRRGDAAQTPWYQPFGDGSDLELGIARNFTREGEGVWAADSPPTLFEFLDVAEDVGLKRLVSGYLGERPAISVKKVTLRRTTPQVGTTWWHQDGAFLGDDIRSLNVWLALSPCGSDAPGLDLVPRRFDRVLETGTEGAAFSWTVAPDLVEGETDRVEVSRPIFNPGDALLFDHLFLHRTGTSPEMTKTRYAVESWFFTPSSCPEDQIPLVA